MRLLSIVLVCLIAICSVAPSDADASLWFYVEYAWLCTPPPAKVAIGVVAVWGAEKILDAGWDYLTGGCDDDEDEEDESPPQEPKRFYCNPCGGMTSYGVCPHRA